QQNNSHENTEDGTKVTLKFHLNIIFPPMSIKSSASYLNTPATLFVALQKMDHYSQTI
ncbi:hypothetical protein L9F63_024454, partial [Diploptera punctata]